jgi:hypothetical protein
MRFGKKFLQPCFAANSPGKIQFMKNRKLFLGMKDGNIVE